MSGPSHSTPTPQRQQPAPSTGPAPEGGDLQPGGNQAALEDMTWEESGNLIGRPPVRDRVSPPNIGIVEDEGVYGQRVRAAEATLAGQHARYASFTDNEGNVTDHRFWFAKVYSFVTEEELRHIRGGTFYYPSYVAESVRYFDQLYVDNVNAWDNGGQVEEHWREAFQLAADSSSWSWRDVLTNGGGGAVGAGLGGAAAGLPGLLGGAIAGYFLGDATEQVYTAVENLVASMQAHIRFDLPRAEAWVYNTHYAGMENAELANFQPDFMSMMPVFERAGERMNDVIAEKTNMPVTLMPRVLQDMAMDLWFDADMDTERADTWQRAEELVANGSAGTGPYTDVDGELVGDATTSDNMSMLDSLSPDLVPSMDSSATGYDDNEVRELNGNEDLTQRSTSDRIRMLRALMSGLTLNADERTILDIIDASISVGDVVTVIDGANAWVLASNVHGKDYKQLHERYVDHYYPNVSQGTALSIILRCLDGRTSGWQQEMVADILTLRGDGRELITQIGAHYSSGGFDEGLNKLEWQLSGSDERRVTDMYGSSSSFW